ncbi:MAG TPA: outer membrane beta-barrel protein [Bacteroidales bacterium]|jgi:hypothetical protein|nr:outer membrane beta-barrel protein [Bacteroidales bacterium]
MKYIAILIMMVVCQPVSAQEPVNQPWRIGFGIEGGISLQTLSGNDYWGEALGNRVVAGYAGGVNIVIPVLPDLFLQPGIMIISKGAKQDIISDNIVKKVNLLYLAVPLDILFRPRAGNGHLLMGAGPYAALGLAGNETTRSGSASTKLKARFLADASGEPTTYVYYKAIDAGIDLLFGYEFYSNIYCRLNSQIGFLKINSDYGLPNDRTSKKNLGFGLSAGYRF